MRNLFKLVFLALSVASAGAQSLMTSGGTLTGPLYSAQINNNYYAQGYPAGGCTVGGVTYTHQLSCAFYSLVATNSTAVLHLSNNPYGAPYDTEVPLIEPATGGQVSIVGEAIGDNRVPTEIRAVEGMGPIITHAAMAANASVPYSLMFSNFNIDGNLLATGCMDIEAVKVGYAEHIHCRNAIGTDAWMRFGRSNAGAGLQGGGYQYFLTDLFVSGSGLGGGGVLSATMTGGVPVITVTSPGAYNYAGAPLYLVGTGAGNGYPCTTMGTGTASFSGSTPPYSLTAVSASGFSGCSGTITAYVPDIPLAQYGIAVDGITDTTTKDLVVAGVGQVAGIYYGSGSNLLQHDHAYGGMPVLMQYNSADVIVSPEADTPQQYGIALTGNGPGSMIYGLQLLWGNAGGNPPVGANGIYSSGTAGISLFGSHCNNVTVNSSGFNLLVQSNGVVPHNSSATLGTILSAQQCDNLTTETHLPNLTLPGGFTGPGWSATSSGGLSVSALAVAPNATASSSNPLYNVSENFVSKYWNGSAGASDTWSLMNALGTGTNPAAALNFVHSGGGINPVVTVPALAVTGAATAQSIAATGALSGSSVSASGAITGASVAATGAITGASIVSGGGVNGSSITASGAVTGASVVANGPVSGTSVAASGALTGASLAATGPITGSSITASGALTGGSLVSSGAVSGSSIISRRAVSGASLSSSGPITGSSIAASGALTGASVVSTGPITGTSITASGVLTGASLVSSGPVSGTSIAASGALTAASVASTGLVTASKFGFGAQGASFSSPPVMVWSPYGGCSTAYVGCQEGGVALNLINPVTIQGWTLYTTSNLAACTTPPVLSLLNGSATIASITMSNGVQAYNSAITNAAVPANSSLQVKVTTAGVGCTTNASNFSSNVTYSMQ